MRFDINLKRNWCFNNSGNYKTVLLALCMEMGIYPNETCLGFLLNYSLPPEYRGLGRTYLDLQIMGKGGRSLIKFKFKILRHLG